MPLNILRNFIKVESTSGIVLIGATLLALLLANTPLQNFYYGIFHTNFALNIFNLPLSTNLLLIVNDGLMAIFFFLVSLEIKRELLTGELSSRRTALLPGIAALGGMLYPAVIFFLFNYAHPEYHAGWAIPTATDIAFSLGILSLLGPRIPTSLKSFLMALAILDDLGAIVIIAVFYTNHINLNYLLCSALLVAILALLNYLELRRFWWYGIVGAILWCCLMKAGIHATIAGVITGFAVPLSFKKDSHYSLLKNLENQLHPWVAYGVLPLFAFANAGLNFTNIQAASLLNPLVIGIAAGLFLGKQLGILGASWLAVKLRLAQLPLNVDWRQFYGVGCLCGIGFTMSLFIGTLAFGEENTALMELIRLGVFGSSIIAGILGYSLLYINHHSRG